MAKIVVEIVVVVAILIEVVIVVAVLIEVVVVVVIVTISTIYGVANALELSLHCLHVGADELKDVLHVGGWCEGSLPCAAMLKSHVTPKHTTIERKISIRTEEELENGAKLFRRE